MTIHPAPTFPALPTAGRAPAGPQTVRLGWLLTAAGVALAAATAFVAVLVNRPAAAAGSGANAFARLAAVGFVAAVNGGDDAAVRRQACPALAHVLTDSGARLRYRSVHTVGRTGTLHVGAGLGTGSATSLPVSLRMRLGDDGWRFCEPSFSGGP